MGARKTRGGALPIAGVLLFMLGVSSLMYPAYAADPPTTAASTRPATPPILSLLPPLTYDTCVSVGGVVESTTAGDTVASLKLDWGDGITTAGTLPAIHNYAHDGTYTVTASAVDSFGLTSTNSVLVRITGNRSLSSPTLVILPPSVGGEEVSASGVVNLNLCGNNKQRAFVSWGDSDEQEVSLPGVLMVSHNYTANGIFNVCVHVNDTFSQGAQHCDQVMVRGVVGGDGAVGPTDVEVTVMDVDFKAVPNATVQMANAPDDQDLLRCMTDSRGSCKFIDIKPGEYFFVAIAQGIGSRAEGAVNVSAHHTGHALALWNASTSVTTATTGLIPSEVGTIAAVVGAVAAAAGAIWEVAKKTRRAIRRRAEPP